MSRSSCGGRGALGWETVCLALRQVHTRHSPRACGRDSENVTQPLSLRSRSYTFVDFRCAPQAARGCFPVFCSWAVVLLNVLCGTQAECEAGAPSVSSPPRSLEDVVPVMGGRWWAVCVPSWVHSCQEACVWMGKVQTRGSVSWHRLGVGGVHWDARPMPSTEECSPRLVCDGELEAP